MDNLYIKTEELLYNYNAYKDMALNEHLNDIKRRSAATAFKKVNNTLEILSYEERKLIQLKYFENKSINDITSQLGYIKTISIKNKLSKLINKIIPVLVVGL